MKNYVMHLDRMYDAKIPTVWIKLSWESSTLGAWFTDLYARNEQYRSWLKLDKDTRPIAFWMTGFFNPQGFLTAMRQVNLSNLFSFDLIHLIISRK